MNEATTTEATVGPVHVDGPRYSNPFRFLAEPRSDPLGFLQRCHRQYGDVVEFRFGPFRSFLFVRPEHVRHVLQENHRNYWKGLLVQKMKRISGEGLVFSDGPLWRRQRQLIQPAFHRERIAALSRMMIETTGELLERWHVQARSERRVDVADEMTKLALEIVAKALFGTDLRAHNDEMVAAVGAGMTYANHLMNHLSTPPLWVPTRANREGRRAIERLDRVVNDIIAQRRRERRSRDDLLDMLIEARDAETAASMDDKQLRDEIVTFLVAGHETTAVALAWTWHLLAENEAIETRLQAELAKVPASSPLELANVPYVRMTLEESMRLYPPAWGTSRDSYGEDCIGGVRIPARTTISVSPYLTHRHPEFWDDPERFDPERFTPQRSAIRPEYAYFPFGGGPRGCVGKQFAMLESQIVLAMTARHFRLRSVPGHPVEPYPIFTLRPRYGLLMSVEER